MTKLQCVKHQHKILHNYEVKKSEKCFFFLCKKEFQQCDVRLDSDLC